MSLNIKLIILPALLASGLVMADRNPYLATRVLTLPVANKLAMAAQAHCEKLGYQVGVTVTSREGTVLVQVRHPLAGVHSLYVSKAKAYTAATFQADTMELQKSKTMHRLRAAPNLMLVGGGIPIRVGGKFYGAVGVSGAPGKKVMGDVDHQCGRAGIKAVSEVLEFAE